MAHLILVLPHFVRWGTKEGTDLKFGGGGCNCNENTGKEGMMY